MIAILQSYSSMLLGALRKDFASYTAVIAFLP